jgi:hypothetical protein
LFGCPAALLAIGPMLLDRMEVAFIERRPSFDDFVFHILYFPASHHFE